MALSLYVFLTHCAWGPICGSRYWVSIGLVIAISALVRGAGWLDWGHVVITQKGKGLTIVVSPSFTWEKSQTWNVTNRDETQESAKPRWKVKTKGIPIKPRRFQLEQAKKKLGN